MGVTATYNPAEVERLVREAREDDARMVPSPWTWLDGVLLWNEEADHCVLQHGGPLWPVSEEHKAGIARTRNNLRAMADQLEAARAEIERLRPIVEAVAGAADDQTIGSVKVFAVGERVTAQYLPVAAAAAVRDR